MFFQIKHHFFLKKNNWTIVRMAEKEITPEGYFMSDTSTNNSPGWFPHSKLLTALQKK